MLTLTEPTNSSSAVMTPDPSQQQNNNSKKQQKQPLPSSLLDDVSDDGSSADDSPYAELGAIAKTNRNNGTISNNNNNNNNDNDISKKSNTSSFSSSFIWIKNQIDGNRVKFVPQSGKISNLTREKIEDFIASSGNPSFSVRDGFILTYNGNFFPKNTTLGIFVSKGSEYGDDFAPGSITLLLQPIHTLPEDEQKKIFLSQMQELKNSDLKTKNQRQEKDQKKLSCSDVASAAVNSNKNIEEKELQLKQEENSLNHRTPQRLLRKGPSASLRIEQDTEEAAIIEKQLLHTSEQSLRRSLKNESKDDDGDNKQNISTHQKKKGTNSMNVHNAGSDCAIVGDCDVFNEDLDEELTSSKSSPHHGGKQTSRSNHNKDNAKSPSSTSISREESSPTTTTTIAITKPSQNARNRANTATSMTSDSAASIRSSSSQPKQTIANNKIKNNQQESSSMTITDTLPSTSSSSSWLIIKNTTNGQNYRFVSPASNVSELSAHRIKEFLLVAVGLNPHYHVLTFQGTKLLPENRKRNLGSFGVFIGSTILVEKSDEYLEFNDDDDDDDNDQGDENEVLVGEMGTQTGDDGSLRNVELFRKRQEERNRRRRADAIAKEFADQRDRIENQETFDRMKLAEDQFFERHWLMVVGMRKEFEELLQVTSSNDGRGTQRDLKFAKNNKRTKTATASTKNPTFYYQHGGGLDIRPLLLVQAKKSGNRENQSEEKSFLGGVGVAKNSSNSRPSTSTAGKDNNKNRNHLESKDVQRADHHKYNDDVIVEEEDEEDDSSSPTMLQLKTFKSSLSDVQTHAHLAALWNQEKIKQQQEKKNNFQGSRNNTKPASRPTSSSKNINNENDEQQNQQQQQPLTASSIRKNRSMNFNGNNTLSSASQSPEKSSNNEGKLLMTSKSFSLFLTNQQKKSKKTKKKENNNNNIINIIKNTASLRDGYEVIQVNGADGGHDEFGNSGNSNSNVAKQNSTGLNLNNSGNTNSKKKTVGFDTSSRKKQQKISADKNNQDGNNNNNNTSYYDNYDDHDDEEPSLYNDDAERNNHNNHLHNRNSNNEFESSDEDDDDEDEEGQRDEDDVQTNKHDDNHRHDYENDKTTSKFATTTPSSRRAEQEQKHRGAEIPPSPAHVSVQKIVSAPPISSRYLSTPLAALLNVSSSSSRTQTPASQQNHNKNNGNMIRDGDEDNREEKHAADNKKLLTWYQPMRYPRPPPPRVGGWLKVDKFDGTFKRMKNPNSVFAEVMEKRRLGIELPPTK